MEHKVIEGTWEEVAGRAQELTGRRVRVTVLDDLSTPVYGLGLEAKAIPDHL